MKFTINENSSFDETEIIINTQKIDKTIEQIISTLRLSNKQLSAKRDGKIYIKEADDIIYFESVDNMTFFYLENELFQTKLKLYEIENKFIGTNIIRISKSVIVNLNHVKSILPKMNGCLELLLENNNKVIVSRHHAKEFKAKLQL